jgi:RNA polymerase sigma factor (sigma-70 family)
LNWFKSLLGQSLRQCSDVDLLAEYRQQNSVRHFDELYNRHQQALYHYLLSQCPLALAQDVFQISWQKVMKQAWQFGASSNKQNFQAWLFTIARNTLIDELRKIKPSVNLDEHIELVDETDAFESKSDELNWLNIQISQLPFFQRETLCLQLEGFSLDDIAQMSDCSVDTIKSRLKLARKKLKETNQIDNRNEEANHENV